MDILLPIFIIYWIGYQLTFIYIMGKYMKKHNIETMKETTPEHEAWSNKLFIHCALWWRFWLNKESI